MIKLLSANMTRLLKSKMFYICLAASAALTVLALINNAIDIKINGIEIPGPESSYFFSVQFTGALIALFTSWFLGTEYSDGTIRNKLITGHTRTNIYLANLITSVTASVAFVAVGFIIGLVGIPVFGVWQIGTARAFLLMLIGMLSAIALSAVMTLVSMLINNKPISIIVCIAVFALLFFASSWIDSSLNMPETIENYVAGADGIQMGEPIPNPSYVRGALRKFLEILRDLLPTGQALSVKEVAVDRPVLCIIFALVFTAVTTAAGILFFNKKDLK